MQYVCQWGTSMIMGHFASYVKPTAIKPFFARAGLQNFRADLDPGCSVRLDRNADPRLLRLWPGTVHGGCFAVTWDLHAWIRETGSRFAKPRFLGRGRVRKPGLCPSTTLPVKSCPMALEVKSCPDICRTICLGSLWRVIPPSNSERTPNEPSSGKRIIIR